MKGRKEEAGVMKETNTKVYIGASVGGICWCACTPNLKLYNI